MRDLEDVLEEKEMELAQVRQQVEALRFIAPLLLEARDCVEAPLDFRATEEPARNRWPLQVG